MTYEKTEQQKSTKTLLTEIVNEMFHAWNDYNEDERSIAIQDALQIKGLPATVANEERIERLVEERMHPRLDRPYSKGDEWSVDEDVEWIWDGWIAEGYFNCIIAMQKVGKSTFCLSLIAELIKRTGSFLNYPLHSERRRIEFVIIGPDMNRRLWTQYGKLSGLLQKDTEGTLRWQEQICAVHTEEDGTGLGKADLRAMSEMAENIKARGAHPFFLLDSYSALMANSHPSVEENSSRYCNPLRQLKAALGRSGATVVLLHHSSQSSSKRSAAESNAGNAAFSRVPDQVLKLSFLADPDLTGSRNDKRVVLSASGRTGRTEPDQLLEQSPDWGWENHGVVGDATRIMHALAERDRLAGDDAICFDLLNTRTGNGCPTTSTQLVELRETVSGGKGSWGMTKVNRLLRKLQRRGLAEIGGKSIPLNGGASYEWWSFERALDDTGLKQRMELAKGQVNSPYVEAVVEKPKARYKPAPLRTPVSTSETQENPLTHRVLKPQSTLFPESNLPTVHMMVEDENGGSSSVIKELLPSTGEVRTQAYGFAQAPIKTKRWLIDVFPSGTYAKAHPVVIDDSEII